MKAIYDEHDLPGELQQYLADNERFVTEPGAPLVSSGGAAKLGALGVDTAMVAARPPRGA